MLLSTEGFRKRAADDKEATFAAYVAIAVIFKYVRIVMLADANIAVDSKDAADAKHAADVKTTYLLTRLESLA